MNASVPDTARRRITLWFLLCFFLRAGAGSWFAVEKPDQFIGVDGAEYLDEACNLREGHGYAIRGPRIWDWEFYHPAENPEQDWQPKPEVFRPPLYPITLAGVFTVFPRSEWEQFRREPPTSHAPIVAGSPVLWAVAVWNALLSTAAAWFLFDLGRRALSRRVAEIGLVVYALYPLGVLLGAKVGAEPLFTLCLAASAWALWRAREERPLMFSLLAGLSLGLATLTRSNAVFLWPCGMLWLLVFLRTYRLAAAWFTLLFVLTLVPWAARNRAVTGHWIFLSASGPYNFWLGNNEVAYRMFTAHSSAEYDAQGKILLFELVPRKVEEMGPRELVGAQQFWYGEAWRFIRDHPLRWVRLVVAKTVEFWRPYVRPGFFPRSYVWVSLVTTLPMFLLGIWGLARLVGSRTAFAWLIVAVVIAGMTGLVLSHVHVRLRVPFVDTFFALCAAYALDSFRKGATPPSS